MDDLHPFQPRPLRLDGIQQILLLQPDAHGFDYKLFHFLIQHAFFVSSPRRRHIRNYCANTRTNLQPAFTNEMLNDSVRRVRMNL